MYIDKGTKTPVVHWLGDVRLVYRPTSAQKPWTMSTVASPFCGALAAITLSSPAALLVFIWRMVQSVSSHVGRLVRRSWAAGGAGPTVIDYILLLSRELKFHTDPVKIWCSYNNGQTWLTFTFSSFVLFWFVFLIFLKIYYVIVSSNGWCLFWMIWTEETKNL